MSSLEKFSHLLKTEGLFKKKTFKVGDIVTKGKKFDLRKGVVDKIKDDKSVVVVWWAGQSNIEKNKDLTLSKHSSDFKIGDAVKEKGARLQKVGRIYSLTTKDENSFEVKWNVGGFSDENSKTIQKT